MIRHQPGPTRQRRNCSPSSVYQRAGRRPSCPVTRILRRCLWTVSPTCPAFHLPGRQRGHNLLRVSTYSVSPADGRRWLASLPPELAAQRQVMAGLLEFCVETPTATSLVVGCSIGRGAADELSDIDGALGIAAPRGQAGATQVREMEAAVVALLPGFGPVVDVLRHQVGRADQFGRRIFAQFADRTQLDLVVIAQPEVRRGSAAPDFVTLYDIPGEPIEGGAAASDARAGYQAPPADQVTAEQVREWAFHGWCALIDLDKYLRRGSLWEAHYRLNEARDQIWALWAAATGAIYPWHGLSQVLDNDPDRLPPGIEETVAGLDSVDLRRAATASATVLTHASVAAAQRHPAELPTAMARYVTDVLSRAS